MTTVMLYDTTLRDGGQGEDISFSLEDKLRIAEKLDDFGIHYIEGGWPSSNQKDMHFFREIKNVTLKNSHIVAFGSTAKSGIHIEDDPHIQSLLHADTPVVTIVGKTWDFHVTNALQISLEQNLSLISTSIRFLKEHGKEVFFDAEHFFDGYKENPRYSITCLKEAEKAGADCIILCDTNGGTMLHELRKIILRTRKKIGCPFGIHTHNDSGIGVANALVAVELGASQVQGTINGYGERCGNANLCSIIPNLKIKMGIDCISDYNLTKLKEVSRFVSELANLPPNKHQPYVGDSAFAHKGGLHVSAVGKNSRTYEHIKPESVGNSQRVLVSDLAGKSNIVYKASRFDVELDALSPLTGEILKTLKELEFQGFQFEGAEGSFELLIRKALGKKRQFFNLMGFRVISEKRRENEESISEATIMVNVEGNIEHTAAIGNGPVNALDNALRKALERFYPELSKMELVDYKVRVLSEGRGTASKVRVLIESKDKHAMWGTVGVSENIIEASWQALVDSVQYKLLKDMRGKD